MIRIQEREGLDLTGRWRLTARHKVTGETIVKEGPNLRVTAGKVMLANALIEWGGVNPRLTYCAIGTDDTAPVVGDTALGAEVARKTIASRLPEETGVEKTFSTFFSAGESTYNIKEAGIFGDDAGAGSGSGTLWSHWLVSFDNSAGNYDITLDYILTVS